MKQNDINDTSVNKLKAQNIENLFNVYTDEDQNYFYNILKTINFPDDLNPFLFYYYDTETKDTWPLIAWKAYKDVKLWWVICAVNNIQNPVAQPVAGTRIKLLTSDVVREILNEIKRS